MSLLLPESADLHQPLEQLVLRFVDLLWGQLAGLPRVLELEYPVPDRRLVVELSLRLLLNALGNPRGSADRGERQGEQAADQAHAPASASNSRSAKLYG